MTAKSFNARNGLSVGTTPTEVVDSSGNITTTTLTATTGNITTLNVTGDLTVTGTTTYVNTTNLNVGDNIVTLNADVTGTPTENAGIEIRRGTSANTALRWNESSDVWEITQDGTNYGRIHSKLTDIVLGTDTSGNYVSTVNSGTSAITITGTPSEGWGPTVAIRSANTSVDGITQLVDSTANSSIIYAATANSVKTTYDLAYGRISAIDLATTANTVANKGILSITPSTGGGAGTRDDVFFVGSGTTTVSSNSLQITISSADQYTGTVTSVGSGNGLTGGAITTAGTLSVVAGNEMVVNASGVHHSDITRTNTTTGNTTLGYSGAFDVVDSITTNARGHVTGVNTKRVTLPASDNTDTTYDLVSVANTAANAGRVRLTSSALANDDILFVGSGTTVVSSNASQVTIATSDQYTGTVTSVGSGNGLTGGAITGSGTLSVLAGTGIVANATGVHVSLTDSVSSTSTTTAATPNSVKTAYDLAASKGTGSVTSVGTGNGLTGGAITTSGTISVVANNGIVANSTGVFVNAQSGLTANSSGLYAVAGSTLVSNATGIHMPNVVTAGSSTGGISAITLDAQGRVTSVTGSAGYLTSAVTSVTGGNGLTGSITTTGSLAVGAGSGITVNADDVAVNAQTGLLANASGLYVRAGTGIVSNATGVHVSLTDSVTSTSTTTAATPNSVKTAYDLAASKGTGTVTSVGSGNGLTGGAITGSGTLSVLAGTGIVANATGVHIGQAVDTTSGVTFANVTIQNNATFGILTQTASGNSILSTANITFTSNTGGSAFYITSSATNAGDSSPQIVVRTGNATGTGSPGNITIQPGSKQYQTGSLLILKGSEQTNTTSGTGGRINIYGGEHTGGGGGGTDVYGGSVFIAGGAVSNATVQATNKRPGSVYIDGGTSSNSTGLVAPSIYIGTSATLSNVVIGSATSGNTIIYANGSVGTAGQVLHSNGTSTYWATDDNSGGTVTSVATGNGLTGGSITTTGTISVVANNGIVANSTGVFVNAGNGLVANSTGVHMASVATAGSSTGGISAITIDTQGRVTSVTGSAGYLTSAVTSVTGGNGLTGSVTTTGSLAVGAGSGITVNADDVAVNAQSGLVANATGLYVRAGTGIVSNATGVHVSLTDSVSSTSTTTAATPNSVKTAYDLAASKGTGTVTSVAGGTGLTGGTITSTGTLSVNASYIATISSNNASYLGGTAAASYALKADTHYIGTTSIALNRSSASQTLTGVSIDGSAGSVAWTNVTSRPTNVSSFTNDSGYITSSGQSVNKYAALRYSYTYDYGTRYSAGTGFSYSSYGAKNISSLTWNSDGDITINFTNAFSDANYKAFLQGPGDSTHAYTGIKSQTTTSCRATTKYTANSTGGQYFLNSGYTHNFMAVEFA